MVRLLFPVRRLFAAIAVWTAPSPFCWLQVVRPVFLGLARRYWPRSGRTRLVESRHGGLTDGFGREGATEWWRVTSCSKASSPRPKSRRGPIDRHLPPSGIFNRARFDCAGDIALCRDRRVHLVLDGVRLDTHGVIRPCPCARQISAPLKRTRVSALVALHRRVARFRRRAGDGNHRVGARTSRCTSEGAVYGRGEQSTLPTGHDVPRFHCLAKSRRYCPWIV